MKKAIKRLISIAFLLLVAFIGFLGAYLALSAHLVGLLEFKHFVVYELVSFVIMVVSFREFFRVLDSPDETEDDVKITETPIEFKQIKESESRSSLYYEIMERDVEEFRGKYKFRIRSRNHETICESDYFFTRNGAETGLYYLIDKIKTEGRIDPWN